MSEDVKKLFENSPFKNPGRGRPKGSKNIKEFKTPKIRPLRDPIRNRPEHLPEGWQDTFLEELERIPVVTRAARIAGVSHRTVYSYREVDEEFQKEWDWALSAGKDRHMEFLFELAHAGDVSVAIFIYRNIVSEKNAEKEKTVTVGWGDD